MSEESRGGAPAVALPPSGEWLRVESIDLEAQGVAHTEAGKVVFNFCKAWL